MAMVDDFDNSGMGSKVSVKKDELLAAIRKNREGHREEFLEAQKWYRVEVIEQLDRMLADARDGKELRVTVNLVAPQEHTKDYDRVIRMLEMSTADTITVGEQQFAQYVLDEWGWMQAFKTSTSTYNNRR